MERWPRRLSGCLNGATTNGCSWTQESRPAKSACGVPWEQAPRPFGYLYFAWVYSYPCCLLDRLNPMTTAPKLQNQPYRIPCATIWGGIEPVTLDVCTKGVTASLHSTASGGERGGDIYYMSVCSIDLLTRMVVADVR